MNMVLVSLEGRGNLAAIATRFGHDGTLRLRRKRSGPGGMGRACGSPGAILQQLILSVMARRLQQDLGAYVPRKAQNLTGENPRETRMEAELPGRH